MSGTERMIRSGRLKVRKLQKQNYKSGLLRPKNKWGFPVKQVIGQILSENRKNQQKKWLKGTRAIGS